MVVYYYMREETANKILKYFEKNEGRFLSISEIEKRTGTFYLIVRKWVRENKDKLIRIRTGRTVYYTLR